MEYLSKVCKKNNIQFVECVTGFNKINGRYFPKKEGILIFKKD